MIEQVQGNFVLTACFLLTFFVMALLVERYKIIIQTYLAKQSWLWKIPWDPTRKIICLWAGILFSRKLIYYLPIPGVIQTKHTVWGGKEYIVFVIFVFFWISGVLIQTLYPIFHSKSKSRKKLDKHMFIFVGAGIFAFFSIYRVANVPFGHYLIVFFTVPLLVLKMVFQGKYLGLLTSLIVVFFSLYGYKKRKKISLRIKEPIIFFLLVGVIILGITTFWGDWNHRFMSRVQIAKTQSAFEELLEAAQSITDNNYKSNALKHIAAAIAKTGDTRWAAAVASGIADEEIKNKALEEIRKK